MILTVISKVMACLIDCFHIVRITFDPPASHEKCDMYIMFL